MSASKCAAANFEALKTKLSPLKQTKQNKPKDTKAHSFCPAPNISAPAHSCAPCACAWVVWCHKSNDVAAHAPRLRASASGESRTCFARACAVTDTSVLCLCVSPPRASIQPAHPRFALLIRKSIAPFYANTQAPAFGLRTPTSASSLAALTGPSSSRTRHTSSSSKHTQAAWSSSGGSGAASCRFPRAWACWGRWRCECVCCVCVVGGVVGRDRFVPTPLSTYSTDATRRCTHPPIDRLKAHAYTLDSHTACSPHNKQKKLRRPCPRARLHAAAAAAQVSVFFF